MPSLREGRRGIALPAQGEMTISRPHACTRFTPRTGPALLRVLRVTVSFSGLSAHVSDVLARRSPQFALGLFRPQFRIRACFWRCGPTFAPSRIHPQPQCPAWTDASVAAAAAAAAALVAVDPADAGGHAAQAAAVQESQHPRLLRARRQRRQRPEPATSHRYPHPATMTAHAASY